MLFLAKHRFSKFRFVISSIYTFIGLLQNEVRSVVAIFLKKSLKVEDFLFLRFSVEKGMVLVIFVHFDRHVSMQRPGYGRMKKLTHQPEFLTICKILNISNKMILSKFLTHISRKVPVKPKVSKV